MTLNQVLQAHSVLINNFGGSHGVRDINGLDAALNRPFATFDGKDLYPTMVDKAAAVFESILINHPFLDGNKRTGYVLMRMFLMQNGQDIIASQDENTNL